MSTLETPSEETPQEPVVPALDDEATEDPEETTERLEATVEELVDQVTELTERVVSMDKTLYYGLRGLAMLVVQLEVVVNPLSEPEDQAKALTQVQETLQAMKKTLT